MADPRLEKVVQNCRNDTATSCGGYLEPTATGQPGSYISTVLLSTGGVFVNKAMEPVMGRSLDPGMADIVSYDRAERNDAYIGEINMLQASSFSGVNGAIWGYDLAVNTHIGNMKPVGNVHDIPIYSLQPLRDSTRQLFGVADFRHFAPQKGSMFVCAEKSHTTALSTGNLWVWCALGFAIAEDRNSHACLFLEDTGEMQFSLDDEQSVIKKLSNRIFKIAYAAYLCGEDQGARYKEIYVGWKASYLPERYVGCSLTCAPYVTLPSGAFKNISPVTDILDLTTPEWLDKVGLAHVDEPDYALHTISGPAIPGGSEVIDIARYIGME